MESICRGDHRLVFRPDLDRNPSARGLWGDPHDEARAQLHERLRAAIADALTDKQREAVELYFFEGLPQDEIARRLGVSQQVIHRRIYGARRSGRTVGGAIRKLRAALAEVTP